MATASDQASSPRDDGDGDMCSPSSPYLREQDRYLPIANISKIMKKALPPNAKIAKDAKGCVQECVSEFISFITSEANERCQLEKRKTISGDDILWAMVTLGFDNYVEPLKLYLAKYRESLEGEKSTQKKNLTFHDFEDKEASGGGMGSSGIVNLMGLSAIGGIAGGATGMLGPSGNVGGAGATAAGGGGGGGGGGVGVMESGLGGSGGGIVVGDSLTE